jgi:hypothetical protein
MRPYPQLHWWSHAFLLYSCWCDSRILNIDPSSLRISTSCTDEVQHLCLVFIHVRLVTLIFLQIHIISGEGIPATRCRPVRPIRTLSLFSASSSRSVMKITIMRPLCCLYWPSKGSTSLQALRQFLLIDSRRLDNELISLLATIFPFASSGWHAALHCCHIYPFRSELCTIEL